MCLPFNANDFALLINPTRFGQPELPRRVSRKRIVREFIILETRTTHIILSLKEQVVVFRDEDFEHLHILLEILGICHVKERPRLERLVPVFSESGGRAMYSARFSRV